MPDILFTKDGAKKTLPDRYLNQMKADGWKPEGKIPDPKETLIPVDEDGKELAKAPAVDLKKQVADAKSAQGTNKPAAAAK